MSHSMSGSALFQSALLVEDEPNLGTALEIAISQLGIPCRRAVSLEQAVQEIQKEKPDFILLDRNLPDGDGLDLCTSLRSEGYSGAVLVLTAIGEIEDRVLGLNQGADDYLAKPFSWDELEARVRAIARRKTPTRTAPIKESTDRPIWSLIPDRLQILGPKGWVELTPLEFKLAEALIAAQGSIISRDTLLKQVWGFTLLPKTRTVDHFLGRLRKHFEENPDQPAHFLTVRGAGYRFQARAV